MPGNEEDSISRRIRRVEEDDDYDDEKTIRNQEEVWNEREKAE
jgi:hypothetical protein